MWKLWITSTVASLALIACGGVTPASPAIHANGTASLLSPQQIRKGTLFVAAAGYPGYVMMSQPPYVSWSHPIAGSAVIGLALANSGKLFASEDRSDGHVWESLAPFDHHAVKLGDTAYSIAAAVGANENLFVYGEDASRSFITEYLAPDYTQTASFAVNLVYAQNFTAMASLPTGDLAATALRYGSKGYYGAAINIFKAPHFRRHRSLAVPFPVSIALLPSGSMIVGSCSRCFGSGAGSGIYLIAPPYTSVAETLDLPGVDIFYVAAAPDGDVLVQQNNTLFRIAGPAYNVEQPLGAKTLAVGTIGVGPDNSIFFATEKAQKGKYQIYLERSPYTSKPVDIGHTNLLPESIVVAP